MRVAVAMSGGVDSSVAAFLLKKAGHDVIGVTMKIWNDDIRIEKARHACYGPEKQDIEDARKVAKKLGIPFHVFDLREEYKKYVLNYFYEEYLSGRTPNPCIRCNKMVKLGVLIEKIRENIDFDYVATGHYARVKYDENRRRYLLLKGIDPKKDQSYGLCLLTQEQLAEVIFPLGNYTKKEVRKLASNAELPVSTKPESQDFIAGGYHELFKGTAKPGPILNGNGEIIGWHKGIPFYTIGQRRGIGIQSGKKLYVIGIDARKNAIIVGTKEELFRKELVASQLNWIAIDELKKPIKVKAKIRYSQEPADAIVAPLSDDRVHVKFKKPQMAITPGQVVAFYDGDIVVGGGIIES